VQAGFLPRILESRTAEKRSSAAQKHAVVNVGDHSLHAIRVKGRRLTPTFSDEEGVGKQRHYEL